MDILFMIRSGIFFTAGLILILFPKQVYSFQKYVLDKIKIKYDEKKANKANKITGYIFIIISILLFLYSINI